MLRESQNKMLHTSNNFLPVGIATFVKKTLRSKQSNEPKHINKGCFKILNKSRFAWTSMLALPLDFHWHCTTVEANKHFQLMFNRFRAFHACNGHLSWMNNAGPPTERCVPMPHMPKYPFVKNTKKFYRLTSIHPVLLLCMVTNSVQSCHEKQVIV